MTSRIISATVALVLVILAIIGMLTYWTAALFSTISWWPIMWLYAAIATVILINEVPKWIYVIPADPYTVGAPKSLGDRLKKEPAMEGKVFLPLGKGVIFDFEPLNMEPRGFKWEFPDVLLDNYDQGNKKDTIPIIVTVEGQVVPNPNMPWDWLENEGQWENVLRATVEQAIREQARHKEKPPHTWEEATKNTDPFVKAALECLMSSEPTDEFVKKIRRGAASLPLSNVFGTLKMLAVKALVPKAVSDAATAEEVQKKQNEIKTSITANKAGRIDLLVEKGIPEEEALRAVQLEDGEIEYSATKSESDWGSNQARTIKEACAAGGQLIVVAGSGGSMPPIIPETKQKGSQKKGDK